MLIVTVLFRLFETRIASAHLADTLKQKPNEYQNGQSAFKYAWVNLRFGIDNRIAYSSLAGENRCTTGTSYILRSQRVSARQCRELLKVSPSRSNKFSTMLILPLPKPSIPATPSSTTGSATTKSPPVTSSLRPTPKTPKPPSS